MRILLSLALIITMASPALAESTLTVESPYAFATAPTAKNGAAFMVITNAGPDHDRLVSASADVSEIVEIHENYIENETNRMRMRALNDGLTVPASQSITLAPDGYHIMFIRLNAPLEKESTFPLTLSFEKTGDITVDVKVITPGQKADTSDIRDTHNHDHHDHGFKHH